MARGDDRASANAEPGGERFLLPFREFVQAEASGGLLLLACTAVALAWANSLWAESYFALWQTKLTVGLGTFALSKPLLLWVNDGLMAVFFFVVGLEIKRELLVGELASPRRAALPIAAAIGGMAVPAAIYVVLNAGLPGARGWGIPMATDIAFALGVAALLGRRVPASMKVFLAALAIVDDIGAVLVIALFYTADLVWPALAAGAGILIILALVNLAGVRSALVYGLLGLGLWFAFLQSGIHATVAGVLLAMAIPSRAGLDADAFLVRGRTLLNEFQRACLRGGRAPISEEQQTVVQALTSACEHVQPLLQRLEHALHPWVSFVIVPLFALANAGVAFRGEMVLSEFPAVPVGVFLGLVVGKPLGITLLAWLAVRFGLAARPNDAGWRQVFGIGCLGGIGFTMSLFIAGLAFGGTPLLDAAKVGILAASVVAGLAGWLILRGAEPR